MATEKKQSFFGGAAVLAVGVVIVKIIGALFKIPLANILSETGNADFNNAYNIYAVLLTISTAGLPVALSKMISEAKTLGRERQARRVLKVSFAAFLTLGVLSFVIMWLRHRPRTPGTDTPEASGAILKRLLSIAIPITLSASMVSIITLIDTSLVQGQLQNALGYTLKETRHLYGTYSSGMNLYNLPSSMMTALTISVIPTVSASLARNDRVHTSRVINSSLRVTGLMAFPMGLGLWALAEPIMKLCYPRYDSELGGSLLAVLGIASMFVCLMLISNSILQSYGRVHVPVFTMLIGGVVKIIFNYNLTAVPSINIHAAPFGTLVCFVIVSSLNLFFVYRTMEDKPNYFKVFAKPLVASLVMAVCARFSYRFFAAHIALGGATTTQIVNVGLAVVLAVIVYVALVLALRIVTRDDLALLPKGEKLAHILHVR